ncbi:TolB family protein [Humidisolicoccus flavus]|uniref:TolB family protein n=1 Tax=Humidisolicoccus flavus TaxID=3111414 RepID=UPI00324B3CA7
MMQARALRPGQRSEIWVANARTGVSRRVLELDSILFEAPNWSLDGRSLYLNGNGELWKLELESASLSLIELPGVPGINNDHVLAPRDDEMFVSGNDGHLYWVRLSTGVSHQLTHDDSRLHFLHGVSPDGKTLAYIGIDRKGPSVGAIYTMPSSGGESTRIELPSGHVDGAEFSPDGAWIYCNTESFTEAPGHAQIARVPRLGGETEHLLSSASVDWFPHLSPDGTLACYLRYPAGTQSHPEDLDVEIVTVRADDWSSSVSTIPLFGGQGTINVNSWSPDSSEFAFVAYPISEVTSGANAPLA